MSPLEVWAEPKRRGELDGMTPRDVMRILMRGTAAGVFQRVEPGIYTC